MRDTMKMRTHNEHNTAVDVPKIKAMTEAHQQWMCDNMPGFVYTLLIAEEKPLVTAIIEDDDHAVNKHLSKLLTVTSYTGRGGLALSGLMCMLAQGSIKDAVTQDMKASGGERAKMAQILDLLEQLGH